MCLRTLHCAHAIIDCLNAAPKVSMGSEVGGARKGGPSKVEGGRNSEKAQNLILSSACQKKFFATTWRKRFFSRIPMGGSQNSAHFDRFGGGQPLPSPPPSTPMLKIEMNHARLEIASVQVPKLRCVTISRTKRVSQILIAQL